MASVRDDSILLRRSASNAPLNFSSKPKISRDDLAELSVRDR